MKKPGDSASFTPACAGVTMPRYYFDTRDGAHFFHDDEGVELPDAASACAEAARATAEMARDVRPGQARRTITVEVRDEANQPICMAALFFEIVKPSE